MRHLLAIVCLLLALPGSVGAADIVLNNGLAPPNPANVIDDTTHQSNGVYVRNVGCPPLWPAGNPYDPCPSPGARTRLELVAGGDVLDLRAYDTSRITVKGGDAGDIAAHDGSVVTVTGGAVSGQLQAYESSSLTITSGSVGGYVNGFDSSIVRMSGGTANDVFVNGTSHLLMIGGVVTLDIYAAASSTITMRGGSAGGDLFADDSSIIRIVGTGFEVDGSPVSFGDLTAQTGTLTGTLLSGDSIDNVFHQGDVGGGHEGTITLVSAAEVVPAASRLALVSLAALLLTLAFVTIRSIPRA